MRDTIEDVMISDLLCTRGAIKECTDFVDDTCKKNGSWPLEADVGLTLTRLQIAVISSALRFVCDEHNIHEFINIAVKRDKAANFGTHPDELPPVG